MGFPKGKPRPPGAGRRKGVPNKSTTEVREAIARMLNQTADEFVGWLTDIDDPAKRCDIWLKAAEYHVPKLARTEVTGNDGGPVVIVTGVPEPRA